MIEGACAPAVIADAISVRVVGPDALTQFVMKPVKVKSGLHVLEALERPSRVFFSSAFNLEIVVRGRTTELFGLRGLSSTRQQAMEATRFHVRVSWGAPKVMIIDHVK